MSNSRIEGTQAPVTEVFDAAVTGEARRDDIREVRNSVRHVHGKLGISQPGATNLLRRLTAHGILREQGSGTGVRHRWFSDEVLGVLDPD